MDKEIIQLGSSLAVIIPSPIAKKFHLKKGDHLRFKVSGQALRIDPLSRLIPVKLRGAVHSQGASLADFRRARSQVGRALKRKWKNF